MFPFSTPFAMRSPLRVELVEQRLEEAMMSAGQMLGMKPLTGRVDRGRVAAGGAVWPALGASNLQRCGSWDVRMGDVGLRLVKDRCQYSADGPMRELAAEGLWRSYDSFDEFSLAVVGWATQLARVEGR